LEGKTDQYFNLRESDAVFIACCPHNFVPDDASWNLFEEMNINVTSGKKPDLW